MKAGGSQTRPIACRCSSKTPTSSLYNAASGQLKPLDSFAPPSMTSWYISEIDSITVKMEPGGPIGPISPILRNLKNTAQLRFEWPRHIDAASFERLLYHLDRPPHTGGARVSHLERRQQRFRQSAVGWQSQIILDALIIALREGAKNLFVRIRPASDKVEQATVLAAPMQVYAVVGAHPGLSPPQAFEQLKCGDARRVAAVIFRVPGLDPVR